MNEDPRYDVPPAFRPPSEPPPGHSPPPPPPSNPITRIEFERVFGSRVLAWIGGFATLLGVIFLMRSAVDSIWFSEEVRTLMAAFGSLLLLAIGLWLHEKKGRLEVARIAVAVAIPGLYATTVVAAQTYDLISPVIGLEAAALIGVLGVFIAVRWSSMLVASVGMLGALAAPMLVGTSNDGGSIAFVALALAASVGVLLWQRWNWLALGAFAVSAPQLILWTAESRYIGLFGGSGEGGEPVLLVLAVLAGFWVLYATAAFGYELRSRGEEKLPVSSWLLLLGSSILVVGLGCIVISDDSTSSLALNGWIFGFAAAHLLLGGVAISTGVHRRNRFAAGRRWDRPRELRRRQRPRRPQFGGCLVGRICGARLPSDAGGPHAGAGAVGRGAALDRGALLPRSRDRPHAGRRGAPDRNRRRGRRPW